MFVALRPLSFGNIAYGRLSAPPIVEQNGCKRSVFSGSVVSLSKEKAPQLMHKLREAMAEEETRDTNVTHLTDDSHPR